MKELTTEEMRQISGGQHQPQATLQQIITYLENNFLRLLGGDGRKL